MLGVNAKNTNTCVGSVNKLQWIGGGEGESGNKIIKWNSEKTLQNCQVELQAVFLFF